MENNKKIGMNPEVKDEDLDAVSGGVITHGRPTPPPGRPDPILDGPDAVDPEKPGKKPDFF